MARCPVDLAGSRVLDAGSGTGAVAARLAASGATVVACDLSSPMIKRQDRRCWPVAVGDVMSLPFRIGGFDAATAGFLLNHLDPTDALRQLRYAVRPGGAVVASTWAAGRDPVKSAIDDILARNGWKPPAWYRTMKTVIEAVSGNEQRLGEAATEAGLMDVSVTRHAENLGVRDPASIVHYRMATPHIFPWIASIDPAVARRLIDDAILAVEPLAPRWRPAVLFLVASVPTQPNLRSAARARAPA